MGEERQTRREAKYAPFFRSFHTVASRLPDEERLAVYDAVTGYCFDGVNPDFSRFGSERGGILSDYFALMSPSIDAALTNMTKTGRPRKSSG